MKAQVTTCQRCGNKQKTVVPWKHVPLCKRCRKPMKDDGPDLFAAIPEIRLTDAGVEPNDLAQRGKESGMERVEAGSNPLYREEAYRQLTLIAYRQPELVSEDVTLAMRRTEYKTRDERVIGVVMMKAARAGVIRKTGRYRLRELGHLGPTPVWESLVYQGETAHA